MRRQNTNNKNPESGVTLQAGSKLHILLALVLSHRVFGYLPALEGGGQSSAVVKA
jgi:hypothetical protein